MKIVFFGTPSFSANILSYLIAHRLDIVAVVTKPDRPKGRSGHPVPPPVKEIALSQLLPLHQPEKASAPEFADTLRAYNADLFVVASYGEIIKQHILDIPRLGCINVHTSLLPKYRGAAPIQQCIINGEKESGVTIMQMVLKLDAGDIIKVVKVPIGENMTAGELENALCKAGEHALIEVIHELEAGHAQRIPQDHSQATFAPKIELEQCQIDWSWSAEKIHNLVRGVNPHPGAWCFAHVKEQQKRIKCITTRIAQDYPEASAGTILAFDKHGIVVACGSGALRILELQVEGKKAMTAQEFACGISKEQLSFCGQWT